MNKRSGIRKDWQGTRICDVVDNCTREWPCEVHGARTVGVLLAVRREPVCRGCGHHECSCASDAKPREKLPPGWRDVTASYYAGRRRDLLHESGAKAWLFDKRWYAWSASLQSVYKSCFDYAGGLRCKAMLEACAAATAHLKPEPAPEPKLREGWRRTSHTRYVYGYLDVTVMKVTAGTWYWLPGDCQAVDTLPYACADDAMIAAEEWAALQREGKAR